MSLTLDGVFQLMKEVISKEFWIFVALEISHIKYSERGNYVRKAE